MTEGIVEPGWMFTRSTTSRSVSFCEIDEQIRRDKVREVELIRKCSRQRCKAE